MYINKNEIERRFLVKQEISNALEKMHKTSFDIKQYYMYDGSRIRQQTNLNNKSDLKFIKTIKTERVGASCKEDECFITKEEFFNSTDRFHSCIMKKREVYEIKNVKYELDTFRSPKFLFKILEIEFDSIESLNSSLKDNNFLDENFKNNIICEITGLNEFSNYNLSLTKG